MPPAQAMSNANPPKTTRSLPLSPVPDDDSSRGSGVAPGRTLTAPVPGADVGLGVKVGALCSGAGVLVGTAGSEAVGVAGGTVAGDRGAGSVNVGTILVTDPFAD